MRDTRIQHNADTAEYFFDEGCHITEWLNDPADPDLSIARARLPAGASTRWHRLHGISERYLLLSGSGRVEVEGLAATEVGPGDVVLIPPGHAQRIHALGEEELVFLALCTPRFEQACYEDIEDSYPGGGDTVV
jgi:mannose-6-phosphate isomerase-like protein (cupin superfamily)